MNISYLPFMRKYLVKYNGEAVAVGDSFAEALGEGLRVLKARQLKKIIWN